ncbi:MAG: hypothetical protein HQK89_07280 [Nitrospirae bacterium]|nr:hypothetical protein [Nitrospirota bacterium]
MDIDQYHEVCKKIAEEGKAEIEVVDSAGTRKRMVATECLTRLKQFAFEDYDISPVSFRNAFFVDK